MSRCHVPWDWAQKLTSGLCFRTLHKWHLASLHVIILIFLEALTYNFSQALRVRDPHSCNTTSEGLPFAGGYYGPRLLKPLPVPSTHAHTHFHCSYTFQGVRGQRLAFVVTELNVGHFDHGRQRCVHGHLRLWDGFSKPGHYFYHPNTICGHHSGIDIKKYTTGANAEVEYHAKIQGRHQHHPGFILSYKYINVAIEFDMFPFLAIGDMKRASAAVCDWSIKTEECHNSFCDILSPGHPGLYPPNLQCQYHVFSQEASTSLQLSFKDFFSGETHFNIRATTSCTEEYIAVYDGRSPDSPLIGQFCGDKVPEITTSGGHIFIQFVTGATIPPYSYNGFHGTVMAITKEWNLSGHLLRGTLCSWMFNRSEGSVSAPDHWLPPQTTCEYTLQSQKGFYMETLLAIYGLAGNCQDRITVTEDGELIDEICQHSLKGSQSRFQYHLVGSQITISYFTARGQYQSSPDRGFWLSFRQIRGPRKQPVIVRLTDEAARYSVEGLRSSSGPTINTTYLLSFMPLVFLYFHVNLYLLIEGYSLT